MRKLIWTVPFVSTALLLGACGGSSPAMDEAMKADLEAASTATIELAPRGEGTKVVSAIESKNPRQPKLTPVRQVTAPARAPRPETPQVTETAATQEPAASRPISTPAVSPPPPGGYKTVGEVIRNAPFPIKP